MKLDWASILARVNEKSKELSNLPPALPEEEDEEEHEEDCDCNRGVGLFIELRDLLLEHGEEKAAGVMTEDIWPALQSLSHEETQS